jgi:rhodanese-related sulfurtransferase
MKQKIMQILNQIFGQAGSCVESIGAGTLIVDVRTPGEFARGHVPGSVNIPLDAIETHVNDLKNKNEPIVLCCASGARSGRATRILRANGIDACNGGSWVTVNNAKLN